MKYDEFTLPARYPVPPRNEGISTLTLDFTWTCYRQPISILRCPNSRPSQYSFTFKRSTEKKRKWAYLFEHRNKGTKRNCPSWCSNTGPQMSFMTGDFLLSVGMTENAWEAMVICSLFWRWYLPTETCLYSCLACSLGEVLVSTTWISNWSESDGTRK